MRALSVVLGLACSDPGFADPGPAMGRDSNVTDLPREDFEPEPWEPCGGRVECRTLEVPIDHDDPDGEQIELSLVRAPHWEGHDFRGVIVLNPGGPGAPGRPFLEAIDARRALGVLSGFDLVAFDPRGVGESGAVPCASGAFPSDAFQSGGAEGLVRLFESDSAACAERMGTLFDHLGSHDVVRDMELIRQALGDAKLNFLGASYGSRLAALYAETFPEHTGAIVLDGPVQPEADIAATVQAQFEALLAAVSEFFADCESGVLVCPLDAPAVADAMWEHSRDRRSENLFAGFWKSLLSQPTGREQIAEYLSVYEFFPEIWDELIDAAPSDMLPLEVAVNQTVHCSDQSVAPPTLAEVQSAIEGFTERSEAFAIVGFPLAACTGWRVAPRPVERLVAPDAPELLLIVGEHDILTPRSFGEQMHASLARSRALYSGHYGHGAVLSGSTCVDEALDAFFSRRELPDDGSACPPGAGAAPD